MYIGTKSAAKPAAKININKWRQISKKRTKSRKRKYIKQKAQRSSRSPNLSINKAKCEWKNSHKYQINFYLRANVWLCKRRATNRQQRLELWQSNDALTRPKEIKKKNNQKYTATRRQIKTEEIKGPVNWRNIKKTKKEQDIQDKLYFYLYFWCGFLHGLTGSMKACPKGCSSSHESHLNRCETHAKYVSALES